MTMVVGRDVTTPNIPWQITAKNYLCRHRITVKFIKKTKILNFMLQKAIKVLNLCRLIGKLGKLVFLETNPCL